METDIEKMLAAFEDAITDGRAHDVNTIEREIIAAFHARTETPAGADREQSLRAMLDVEHQRNARYSAVLSRIYASIYPQLKTTPDGKTYQFIAPDPHVFLQALGDSVRAIMDDPDLAAQPAAPSTDEARYRWLRARRPRANLVASDIDGDVYVFGDDLDRAIDAAMSRAGGDAGGER